MLVVHKHKYTHQESWYIVQRPIHTQPSRYVQYHISDKDKWTGECHGECRFALNTHAYPQVEASGITVPSYLIEVDKKKYMQTHIGDPSAATSHYYNPVRVSDEVIYNNSSKPIPYFNLTDFNHAHRLIAPLATQAQKKDSKKLIRYSIIVIFQ